MVGIKREGACGLGWVGGWSGLRCFTPRRAPSTPSVHAPPSTPPPHLDPHDVNGTAHGHQRKGRNKHLCGRRAAGRWAAVCTPTSIPHVPQCLFFPACRSLCEALRHPRPHHDVGTCTHMCTQVPLPLQLPLIRARTHRIACAQGRRSHMHTCTAAQQHTCSHCIHRVTHRPRGAHQHGGDLLRARGGELRRGGASVWVCARA